MTTTLFFLVLTVLWPVQALWPLPRQLQTGSTPLVLSPQFGIEIKFDGAPADLLAAVAQTCHYLETDKLERLVVGRGAADAERIQGAKVLSSLALSLVGSTGVRSISEEAVDDIEGRDEAYTLRVPADGTAASLTAGSMLGLYRGLTTFAQLWYESRGTTYTLDAPIDIQDSPAYVSAFCFMLVRLRIIIIIMIV
jgi:hexosaminidase